MDGSTILARVNRGYAIAASKTGLLFSWYRPSGALNPIASATLRGALPASFLGVNNYSTAAAVGFGKSAFVALVDGTQVQVGDILIEQTALPGQQPRTFYIAAMQPLLPILAIRCNRTISVVRPTSQSGGITGGIALGHDGDSVALEQPIMTAWPASMLAGTKGEKADDGIPDAGRQPWYLVFLPYAGVEILTDDIMTDTLGHRYQISSCELTELGWRLSVALADD